ncbi:alpha/beta fold hydrolase [Micromonospora sp. NPDC005220]|uniref:alpha/beta fold hydrolase n=1 Tax=Micromonospora sp. NPDC005220 TaxID=3155589 RepID=UPI0033A0442F
MSATGRIRLRCLRPAVEGATPARRVLLLHGLGNSSGVWRATTERWNPGTEVWSADLPWCADGSPAWCHEPTALQDVSDALDRLPVRPDVVVGHSFSANLLLELLSSLRAGGDDIGTRYGVRAIALVCPFYRRSPADFHWEGLPGMLGNFERTIQRGIAQHARREIAADVADHITRKILDRIGPYGWLRFLELYARTPWLRTDLIDVPSLVMIGTRDDTAPPAEGVALAEDLPAGRLIEAAGCGHFPMIEDPGPFVEAVEAVPLQPGLAVSARTSQLPLGAPS